MMSRATALDGVGDSGQGPAGRSVADRLLAAVGGAMVLAALALLLWGGEGDGAAAPASVPGLELIAPAEGAAVPARLELVFRSSQELQRGPGGWGTADHHLHLSLDGMEIMPGPDAIQRVAADHYRWTVGALAPGEHTLRLFWSDAGHRPIAGSGTPPVRVHVAAGAT